MNDRTDVNHGHNEWTGFVWAPKFESWCASCRAAQTADERGRRLARLAGLMDQAVLDLHAERYFDAELHLREAANAAHWCGADLGVALARALGIPEPTRGLDNPAGAGESVEASRG